MHSLNHPLLLLDLSDSSMLPDAPQPRPKIMDQFTANLTIEGFPPIQFPKAEGQLVYDALASVYQLAAVVEYPAFDDVHVSMRWLGTNNGSMYVMSEGCQNNPVPGFPSLFEAFIRVANYSGKSEVSGVACDLWTVTIPKTAIFQGNATLCVAGDKPLQLQTPIQRLTFHDFSSEVDRSKLVVPDACKSIPAPCGDGAISTMPVYVAHPRANYNISGQDVADAKGEAVFLCGDKLMWQTGGYNLISVFELSYVRKFSQYTNYPPPGGKGFGGDQFHIGRETPLSVGKHWGQCDDDAHWHGRIGQWMSLPPAGQCIGSRQKLGEDCTWRISRRVVTIELSCLVDERSLGEQCIGAVAPFEQVQAKLQAALDFEDASKGGCPRVREPECASHPNCAHLAGDCCPTIDGTMLDCCHNGTVPQFVV